MDPKKRKREDEQKHKEVECPCGTDFVPQTPDAEYCADCQKRESAKECYLAFQPLLDIKTKKKKLKKQKKNFKYAVMTERSDPDPKRPSSDSKLKAYESKEDTVRAIRNAFWDFLVDDANLTVEDGKWCRLLPLSWGEFSEQHYIDSYMDMEPFEATVLDLSSGAKSIVSGESLYDELLQACPELSKRQEESEAT